MVLWVLRAMTEKMDMYIMTSYNFFLYFRTFAHFLISPETWMVVRQMKMAESNIVMPVVFLFVSRYFKFL